MREETNQFQFNKLYLSSSIFTVGSEHNHSLKSKSITLAHLDTIIIYLQVGFTRSNSSTILNGSIFTINGPFMLVEQWVSNRFVTAILTRQKFWITMVFVLFTPSPKSVSTRLFDFEIRLVFCLKHCESLIQTQSNATENPSRFLSSTGQIDFCHKFLSVSSKMKVDNLVYLELEEYRGQATVLLEG